MRIIYSLTYNVFQSRIFEFLIIFTFFISLLFSIFKRRFGDHRLTAALAASISFALSIGLTSWISNKGYNMTDLGPFAIIIIVAFADVIIYSLIKRSGHEFIAILTVVLMTIPLIGRIYWLTDYQMIFDMTLTLWLIILIWLLIKNSTPNRSVYYAKKDNYTDIDQADNQIKRMYTDRRLSGYISGQLRKLRKTTELLGDKNSQSTDLILQLQRILPEQGFLSGRMTGLRKKAHLMRNGHIAKIKEIKTLCRQLGPLQKQKVSRQMIEYYQNQTDLDRRLERLEGIITNIEKQSRDLIIRAQICVKNNDFKQYDHFIKKAAKMQDRVTHIIKVIIRTEKNLSDTAHKIVQKTISENV